MPSLTTEERFNINLNALCDLIGEILSDVEPFNKRGRDYIVDPSIIPAAKIYLNLMDKHEVILNFIKRSYEYWDRVEKRDEESLKNMSGIIFAGLPVENIDGFKYLLDLKTNQGQQAINSQHRDEIWDFLNALIRGSKKYMTEKNITL